MAMLAASATENITKVYDPVCESWERPDSYEELEAFRIDAPSAHQVAWIIAGVCVMVSVAMSFFLIVSWSGWWRWWRVVDGMTNNYTRPFQYRHMTYYRRPEQQRHIIR